MKNTEIERKFVVKLEDIPYKLSTMNYFDIKQSYIAEIDKSYSFRLRESIWRTPEKKEIYTKFTQTIKSKHLKVRDEYEIVLNETQYSTLSPLYQENYISKKRYELQYNSHILELDIYNNIGNLNIIEIEFDNIKDCDIFEVPEWFGVEVTDNLEYKNENISLNNGIVINYTEIANTIFKKLLSSDLDDFDDIITISINSITHKDKRDYILFLAELTNEVIINRYYSENEFTNAIEIRNLCTKKMKEINI